MKKAKRLKLSMMVGAAALFYCVVFISKTSYSAILKVSSNTFQTQTTGDPNTSTISFTNDALSGDVGATTDVKGTGGFSSGSSVTANSMYLECPDGGTHIGLTHSAVTFVTDSETNVTSFPLTSITGVDQTALGTLSPPVTQQEYWCSLYIPEQSGRTWKYPNGMRLDKVAPRVDGGRLKTYPIIPFAGGQIKFSWVYADAGTPGDPDGENGNYCPSCGDGTGCWQCNKSDTRQSAQVFLRKLPGSYDPIGGVAASGGGDSTYLTDTITDAGQNRFKQSPSTYCYIWRIIDTAGNLSVKTSEFGTSSDAMVATLAQEKCIVPDDITPSVVKVEYYTGFNTLTGFSGQFPYDEYGIPVLTSNACLFDPINCTQGTQIVRLKIVMSEPLFDAQNYLGATVYAGDGRDNDHGATPVDVDEEAGGFNFVDDDGDGFVDEDVAHTTTTYTPAVIDDHKDNDANGYVDEIPNTPSSGDGTIQTCTAKYYWNFHQQTCVPRPRIKISGPDTEAIVPGPAHSSDMLTFVCTQDGVTTNPSCTGLSYGQTVYEFDWDISGPLVPVGIEEDTYTVTVSGSDGVGNIVTDAVPAAGGSPRVDNTGPVSAVKYYKNNSFSQTFTLADHDNDSNTPKMPVLPLGTAYLDVTADEYLGATPSIYFFLPDVKVPQYEGEPQPDVWTTTTLYPFCGQSASCDYCTGNGCVAYTPDTTSCKQFRGCLTITDTMNNGYAAVTILAKDKLANQAWEATDAQAAADPHDADKLKDDIWPTSGGDGIPNYVLASLGTPEPDAGLPADNGPFFAIDTYPPATPAISLPIAPCDGIVARAEMSCLDSAQTVNNPTLKWTTLLNNTDEDGDGARDEECIDGIDNDSDGTIDEDGKLCGTGTAYWEISQWKLQVATTSTFDSGSIIYEAVVPDVTKQVSALPERPLTAPYYWRVAPYDRAGNIGPYNPFATGTQNAYFTFGVDTQPPTVSVEYFTDSACSIPMQTDGEGIPITGDTASDPTTIVCVKVTTNEEPSSAGVPTFITKQLGVQIDGPIVMDPFTPSSTTVFKATFEVDAKGVGQKYLDGEVFLYFTVKDRYGNTATNVAPVAGTKFRVDASAPEISCSADPSLASTDNDHDGTPDELDDDAVKINCHMSKYIGSSFGVRVKQKNFVTTPAMDDGLDNDCDGAIDEELDDNIDNDGDGVIDEDTGSAPKAGSGCWVTLSLVSSSSYDYEGAYNVVSGGIYDGTATILAGDEEPGSKFYLEDLAGNSIYASSTFEVDTVAPSPPSLRLPKQNAVVNDNTPQVGWYVGSRTSDLYKYRIEIATSSSFIKLAAYKEYIDDGYSNSFYTTIQNDDINFECGTPLQHCTHLTDNKYYWRMFTYDDAMNKSTTSSIQWFTVDTATPSVPIFNSATTPTEDASSELSGRTSPAEANATVNIYVNSQYIGTVTTDSSGNFDVAIDYDSDGLIGEDPIDNVDNDLDGMIDENPDGIFLSEGDNVIEGLVIDQGGNAGSMGCSTSSGIYNSTKQQCIINRDSGPPKFYVTYYSDSARTSPLPIADITTGKQVAKAGTVYMQIDSTEELPSPPTYSVDIQGTNDVGVRSATSVGGSQTRYTGNLEVYDEMSPNYIDGDAKVIVRGTDSQGNQTAEDTLPLSGGYLTIDTKAPTFKVTYWTDKDLQTPMELSNELLPLTKARSIYLRLLSNEPLRAAPAISIDQEGSEDVSEQTTTAVGTTYTIYKYKYDVNSANGTSYVDGQADVTVSATDVAGNTGTGIVPTSGDVFDIDTTAPMPPSIVLNNTETVFTKTSGAGSVVNTSGGAEQYAYVEAFTRIIVSPMTAGDGVDNDGDGRIDEEPGGANAIDDDHDGFIDEDTTSNTCASGQIWSASLNSCLYVPNTEPLPNGTATTDSVGGYVITISGIIPGKNYVYARATDRAGNTSDFGTPTTIIGKIGETETFTHEFAAGWTLLGFPFQPNASHPALALGLSDNEFYQLIGGVYINDAGMNRAVPGSCYWTYFPETTTVTATGVTSTTNTVSLSSGWNMLAIPYNKSVVWNSEILVQAYDGTYSIASTDATRYLDPVIYLYNGATEPVGYITKEISDAYSIQPWEGFLLKVKEPIILIFPSQYQ